MKKKTEADYKFSTLARKNAVFRPFRILTSMSEEQREEIARHLGFELQKDMPMLQSWRGTLAEAQAWQIISKDGKGLQARASSFLRKAFKKIIPRPNWHEIVAGACEAVGVNSKAYYATTLEKRLFDYLARKATERMDEDEREGATRFMNEEKEFTKSLREKGLSSDGIIFVIAALGRLAQKGGFKTYITAVKMAAQLNKRFGMKIAMKAVTKNLKRILIRLNSVLNILLILDILEFFFGRSDMKNVPVIAQIYLFDVLGKSEEE